MLREAMNEDLDAIRRLLNENIRTTTSVYHHMEKEPEYIEKWFQEKREKGFPVFVVEDHGTVLGYGTYGTYRPYAGFDKTVEHSLYVRKERQSQGIGKCILDALMQRAKSDGYHAMVAYIDGDNDASIGLHQKSGFEVCGKLREVGWKFDRYLDLLIMEKLL